MSSLRSLRQGPLVPVSAMAQLALIIATASLASAADDPPRWVDISLAVTNTERGITQITNQSDGQTTGVTVADRNARNLLLNGTGAKYLYLDVDDLYYQGDGPGVTVAVNYYGAGNVTFWLEYDAADGNPVKASTTRNTGSSNTWRKALFWLPDPRFAGNQNGGADLRIATNNENADLYIEFVALARPIGPYVAGDQDSDFSGESFSPSEKIVGTEFFYWYDAYYTRGRFVNNGADDGTDALTAHPALVPGISDCAYAPDDPNNAPLRPADYSFRDTNWVRRQIDEFANAELDVILPVYWGGIEELFWAAEGLETLVSGYDQAIREGHNPPMIGMFFDTSTLQYADPIFGTATPTDLTTEDGRNFYYKQVIDFWSMIPPKYWARIDGKPILSTYVSAFASAWDQQLFDDLNTRFAEVFGGVTPYVVRDISWTGVSTDSTMHFGAALNGPQLNGVASVGPGFDNSQVPPVGSGFYRDRADGATYIDDWNTTISSFSGQFVICETWSEWYESTSIAPAQEWGHLYIDLTQEYAARFEGNWGGTDNAIVVDNTIPQTQYSGEPIQVSLTVKNTGSSVWSEAAQYRLGAVGNSDAFAPTRIAILGGSTVSPGETVTFIFTMTAPAPGSYATDWQMVQDGGAGFFGEIHTESIEVVSGIPMCTTTPTGELIANAKFLGKRGAAGSGVAAETVPDEWRAFSIDGGSGDIAITPLANDTLFAGSPATNAITWSHGSGGDVGDPNVADSALDKDTELLREIIPDEPRVYLSLVDVRDGGVYGGSDQFFTSIQFGENEKARLTGFNPGPDFETIGISDVSTYDGKLSVRHTVGATLGSVQMDNCRVYDVTNNNRLANPGFENSDSQPLNWRVVYISGAAGSVTISNDANSGNNAALFERTNTDGIAQFDTDDPTIRPVLVGGETIQAQFAAKKVSGSSDARLQITIAQFDANGTFLGNLWFEGFDPNTDAYNTYLLPGLQTNAAARFLTFVMNIRSSNNPGVPVTGAYLIDDVVLSTQDGFSPPLGNVLENGDFEDNPFGGTFGTNGSYDAVDDISIPGWRFVGIGGAAGRALQNSNAARDGLSGLELIKDTIPGAGADLAIDKDNGVLQARIPVSPAIYRFKADVRDGGANGGTDYLALSPQFSNHQRARIHVVNPGVTWETIGVTAKWDNGGALGVRLDLGGDPNALSCYVDNVIAEDVTYGVNRLVNPGFENSTVNLSDWRYSAVAGAAGSATLDGDAYSGANAVLLERTNTDGDLAIDLDTDSLRIATLGGETITVDFAAKKVSGADTRLNVVVATFDPNATFIGDIYNAGFAPGSAYSELTTGPLMLSADTAFVSVGFRIADSGGAPAVGSYLIDDVSLIASEPANGGLINLLTNGSFETDPDGTIIEGADYIDSATISDWRAFAVGGAAATYEITTAAASDGLVGIEIARNAAQPSDRAFDNDVHRFEINPNLYYRPSFYVKTGNADNSPQEFAFDMPLFGCEPLLDKPAYVGGLIATSTWQRIDIPEFRIDGATAGHVRWAITPDGGEDAIMIALPSVIGVPQFADLTGDGLVDGAEIEGVTGCLSGPANSPMGTQACACLDADGDGDVDAADLAVITLQIGD